MVSVSGKETRGNGEGEGEREGQEVAERRYEPWLAERGWMKTVSRQRRKLAEVACNTFRAIGDYFANRLVGNVLDANYLPGVMGGEVDLKSAPAARISEKTSPSQPCFTPSMPSPGKKASKGVDMPS